MLLSNKLYDDLKWVAQIALPAVGALYFALSGLWHFPHPQEVVGTVTAVDAFLGLLLGLSTSSYNKSDSKFDGSLALEEREDGTIIRLQQVDEKSLLDKDTVTFKVNR